MNRHGKAGARGSFNNKVINRMGGREEKVNPEEVISKLYPQQEFNLSPSDEPRVKGKKLEEQDLNMSEETPIEISDEEVVEDNQEVPSMVVSEPTEKEELMAREYEEEPKVIVIEEAIEETANVEEEKPDPLDGVSEEEEGDEPLNDYVLEIKKNDRLPQYIKLSPLVTNEAVELIQSWNTLLRKDKALKTKAEKQQKLYEEEFSKLTEPYDDKVLDALQEKYKDRNYDALEIDAKVKEHRDEILNTSSNYIDPDFETNGTKARIFFTKDVPTSNANKNPVAFMDGIVGNAKPIEIIFVNSGFRCTFKYPSRPRRKAFQTAISNMEEELGAYLTTVSMDSYEYLRINELIVELAKELVISSTLDSNDPLAHLTVEDLPILQAGILKSIFPNGLPFELMCIGNSILDEENPGKTKCDKVEYGTVDTQEFIYSDFNLLSEVGREMISRTTKGSISISEVEALLLDSREYTKTVEINGTELKLTFKNVLFKATRDVGKSVLELVRKEVMKSFDKESGDEEELLKDKLATSAIKNNICLVRIEVQGTIFEDPVNDVAVVNSMVQSPEMLEYFYEGLNEYKEERVVKVGVPAYQCGCGTLNGKHLGLRPINLVRLFTVAVIIKD